MSHSAEKSHPMASRFRGFLPVVVDIETAGLNSQTDALLEIAAITLKLEDQQFAIDQTYACHVIPFEGANLDAAALNINRIDPYHPFRFAITEKEALDNIFKPIRKIIKAHHCHRAILVGHNPTFDLNFLQAAVKRNDYKRNPFHPFTTFDTATLAGVALGHTVLSVACKKANIDFNQNEAHSAIYDATKTAELFCHIANQWNQILS